MKKIVEYVFLTLGASIVAMGLEAMLAPNGQVDGGVTALSIMANALWGIPIYVEFSGLVDKTEGEWELDILQTPSTSPLTKST